MLDFNDKRLAPPHTNTPFLGRVITPRMALMGAEGTAARRQTTALYGEKVEVYGRSSEFAQVRLVDDKYTGWAKLSQIGELEEVPTHRVIAPMTYSFSIPDIKSAPKMTLFLNTRVRAGSAEGSLINCGATGWIPAVHLMPISEFGKDPAKCALGLFGAPYLWGGNDGFGVDCSGLTQAAFKACGLQLPRDSDMQFAWSGAAVPDWREPGVLQRNDLVFWKGHVGIMLDSETLLHANGYYMSTIHEPLADAVTRIGETYGPVIGARRIALDGSNSANWRS